MGALLDQLNASFPGKPTWSVDKLPDLSSKVIIVTGGNAGLGLETVKQLLRKNAKVYLAARSHKKAEEAIESLRKETGRDAIFFALDLNNLDDVKRAADDFLRLETRLDVLVLNAGLIYPPADVFTAQGYDQTLGVNLLAHFLLFRLLQPILIASGTASDPARVVWLSSLAAFQPPRVDLALFRDGPARRGVSGWETYRQSKLGMNVLAAYVARTVAARGEPLVSISVDPGTVRTTIFYGQEPWFWSIWVALTGHPVERGALSQVFAAAAPEGKELNGKHVIPFARLGNPAPAVRDEEKQTALWNYLDAEIQKYLS